MWFSPCIPSSPHTGLLQAFRFLGVMGSVPATGGFAKTARSNILPDFLDTRGGRVVTNVEGGMRWTVGCSARMLRGRRHPDGRRSGAVLVLRRWNQVLRCGDVGPSGPTRRDPAKRRRLTSPGSGERTGSRPSAAAGGAAPAPALRLVGHRATSNTVALRLRGR